MPESEAVESIREMDRLVHAQPSRSQKSSDVDESTGEAGIEAEDTGWTDALLGRLHRLSPEGFEEFVMYMLRSYGLELTRVGGTGDQGIDGIGIAPISPSPDRPVWQYRPNDMTPHRQSVVM